MVKTPTGYFPPFVVEMVGVENRPVARGSAKKVLQWCYFSRVRPRALGR